MQAPEEEIPRHTRPFRAWGAAQDRDTGPSLWERFSAWLRGLFTRAKKSDERDFASEYRLASHEETAVLARPRTSFDDLDAPWNENPFPVQEKRSTLPSAERPSMEDFASSWDGTYGREEESDAEVAAAAQADESFESEPATFEREAASFEPAPATFEPEPPTFEPVAEAPAAPVADDDALWDEPIVSETSAPAPQAFESQDLESVWTPREEAPEPALPAAEPQKKKGFFARLFGRKEKPQPEPEPWETPSVEEPAERASELEPADADFADDLAASAAPAEDDFASEPEPVAIDEPQEELIVVAVEEEVTLVEEALPSIDDLAPDVEAPASAVEEPVKTSIDHSADDSATLAALLGTLAPPPQVDEPPVAEPVVEQPKKPGFFSSLLRRVSRSQFIPKQAVEPEPEVVPEPTGFETAAEAEVIEEVEVIAEVVEPMIEPPAEPEPEPEIEPEPEPVQDFAAKWGPPSEPEAAPDPEPIPMPLPEPVIEPELESTQPFPAFRDARDDFADEEPVAAVPDSRPTEQVDIPDEGDNTDEFQVVPPAEEPGETTQAPVGFWGRLFGKKAEVAPTVPGEGAAVAPAADKTPFVLAKFRTFYNEIIRDKHQKSDVISGFATAVLSAPASDMADPEFAAQLLSKRLSEMLELQAAESNWTGGDAAKYYPEAQYAMVALADETFATIDWPGRPSWHKYMLEPRLYGTRGADIEFFKRIDKLLKDPEPSQGARDLARLYLLVIASGFRGKFRVPNVKRPLAEYRRRLYEFSHQADPLDLYARDRRIFPEAVEHTLASRAVGRFTSRQRWIAAVLILAVLYIGVSHYAWMRLSADLKDVMSRIENTDATGRTP